VQALRAEFPVFERLAYLNAGTNGPVPRRAAEAASESLRQQAERGRGGWDFIRPMIESMASLGARVAGLLGCDEAEVALTGSTTGGVNAVLSALDLRAGDEVLTSDEEHPGLLAPLAAARERTGIRIRTAPFAELPHHVRPDTRLVACSHVSWLTGQVMDTTPLAESDALVLLDGAQGLGAVHLDVRALGCDFYAASGQKWLCGPNGCGYLYARAERLADLRPPWPGYHVLANAERVLDFDVHTDARRLGTGVPAADQLAFAHAALDVFQEHGLEAAHRRAVAMAAGLAASLGERGLNVAPRGASTLVSFEVDDPPNVVERLRMDEDMVLRHLPGTPYVRASVGAWTSEEELDRLVRAAA
jgi:selenocysteine lyase/cysteine desulfurase